MSEQELQDLMNSLEGSVEEPKEEPKDEEQKEEIVEEKKEESDGLQGEKEEGKEEVVEEPAKDEEEKEEEPKVDDKDVIIADLQAKLAEAIKPKEEPKKEEEVKEEPLQFTDQDFVGEIDLDEVTRDPKEFNKLLNKIYQQAVTDAKKTIGEGVLKSIPDIVMKNVKVAEDLRKMHDEFYSTNKDLEPFKKVVAVVFEEVASQNQGKSYTDLLKLTAPEVRKRLNLQKVVDIKKKVDPPKLPAKGGKSGSMSTGKPQTGDIQSEIEAMENSLGR
jgi:hypothetical protein